MSIKILLSGKGNMQNYINAVTSCGADAEGSYLPKASSDGYDGLILYGGGAGRIWIISKNSSY